MTHDERIHYHMYETCEGIAEHAERIVALEELVEDMLDCIEIRMAFGTPPTSEMYENFAQRARKLGIEVGE